MVVRASALRINNANLRDRLIAEGKISGEAPRNLTPKQRKGEERFEARMKQLGILNPQSIAPAGAAGGGGSGVAPASPTGNF